MGCDIHGTIEKKVNGKWVMLKTLPDEARDRNYKRFGKLAHVRCEGNWPKFIPEDLSESSLLNIAKYGSYGHSHTWYEMTEAAKIYWETEWDEKKKDKNYIKDYPCCYYFDMRDEPIVGEYRVIFWFDN